MEGSRTSTTKVRNISMWPFLLRNTGTARSRVLTIVGLLVAFVVTDVCADGTVISRPEGTASTVPEPLARFALISVDAASNRAVIDEGDEVLRIVEVGDALLDGRATVEAVTKDKLVLRYRLAPTAPTPSGDLSGSAVVTSELVGVWVDVRRSGESGSRVRVLRRQGPPNEVVQPIADGGEPRMAAEEVEGNGGP